MRTLRTRTIRANFKRLRRRLPSGRDWLMIIIGGSLVYAGFQLSHADEKPAATPLSAASDTSVSIRWLPPGVQRWSDDINQMASRYDIDPNLLAIIMTIESGGNPQAESGVGAKGLMQIMPATAQDIAKRYVRQPVQQYDLFDARTSIEFGAAYLSLLRNEFGTTDQAPTWNTTVELIAAGYNGGPSAASALDDGEGLHDMQTVSYSRDAYNMWRERHAGSSPTYERWLERGGSALVNKAASSL